MDPTWSDRVGGSIVICPWSSQKSLGSLEDVAIFGRVFLRGCPWLIVDVPLAIVALGGSTMTSLLLVHLFPSSVHPSGWMDVFHYDSGWDCFRSSSRGVEGHGYRLDGYETFMSSGMFDLEG
ncbi:hypothetical protein BJX96DRAFT_150131 [Aspergillus floccosus]